MREGLFFVVFLDFRLKRVVFQRTMIFQIGFVLLCSLCLVVLCPLCFVCRSVLWFGGGDQLLAWIGRRWEIF